MSKRGSGSSARAGGDSTMKSFGGGLPELQGTPKQIAYAQDIRDGWIKNTFEGYQKEYAERLQKLEIQKKSDSPRDARRREFNERQIRTLKANVEAARIVLSEAKSAHAIIQAKNRVNDVTMDVRDALLEKRSRVEIRKIVSDYGLK